MKINKISSYSRDRWLRKPFSAQAYHAWLINKGSLTARLQQRYSDFSVKLSTVKYARASQGEARLLHFPIGKTALIRDVLLNGGGCPVVFAHSVLPRRSLRGEWLRLGKLGSKPLGATLFANQKVKRTALSYKKLSSNDALYHRAAQYLVTKPDYLWARRSVFSLHCAGIMVTEVFLPDIIARSAANQITLKA